MKEIHPQFRVYIDFQLESYLDHQKECTLKETLYIVYRIHKM